MAPPPPDDAPTFFVDDCLGVVDVPDRLRAAGYRVNVLMHTRPRRDEDDTDWIPEVAANGWVILSKDKRIRRRRDERAALERAKAAVFFLTAGTCGGEQQAEAFLLAMPRIVRLCRTLTRPLIGTVSISGNVTVIVGERRGGVRNP